MKKLLMIFVPFIVIFQLGPKGILGGLLALIFQGVGVAMMMTGGPGIIFGLIPWGVAIGIAWMALNIRSATSKTLTKFHEFNAEAKKNAEKSEGS